MIKIKRAIFFLFILGSVTVTTSSIVILTHQPDNLADLCPGDTVIFTCLTVGSPIIAWTSDDYIGTDQLEFASADAIGQIDISRMDPDTFANLTDNNKQSNVLESTLNIKLKETQNSDVTCIHVGNGTNETIEFHFSIDVPESIPTLKSHVRRSGTGCVVNLQWDLPMNFNTDELSHFVVTINETDQRTESFTNTSYTLCNCNPHNLTIRAVDRCNRRGPAISNISLEEPPSLTDFPMECMPTTQITTTTTQGSEGVNLEIIIISIVAFLAAIGWTLILVFILVIVYLSRKLTKQSKSSSKEDRTYIDLTKKEGEADKKILND